jgi:hypothetical protein
MKLKINYRKNFGKFKNMEIEQHGIEQVVDQRRNQKGNQK